MIGWIYSPDTTINYPVMQGDDNDYYLKHLADGTENRNGCPFLDVQNRPDFTDNNSIIYGHHMQTFGSIQEHTDWLKEVSSRSDFKANLEISAYDRVITLSTCAYRWRTQGMCCTGSCLST